MINLNGDLGFLRIAAAIPELRVADIDYNLKNILSMLKKAEKAGVQVLAFPEMALTGYTIGDLVHHRILINKTEESLNTLLKASADQNAVIIIGLPLCIDQKLFNCAAVINHGSILGIIPKTYLPNYKEFYEERWFASARNLNSSTIEISGQPVPFGTDILFSINGLHSIILGIELCEDLWVPLSPHEYQAKAGANILVNISASNEILGKAEWRRTMISSESGRCLAAYCYVSSGIGESSNDVVFSGHALIAENGTIVQESKRLTAGQQLLISDIDLDRLNNDRQTSSTFHESPGQHMMYRVMQADVEDIPASRLYHHIDPQPFVPKDPGRRAERCQDIFSMQVAALSKKLLGAGCDKLIIGVSGGLDSTLALLVAAKTMDSLKLPRNNIYAFTMPGFGTTRRTRDNATNLCRALEVTFERVNISKTCRAHMSDLKHDGDEDIVFENIQARYRTEFLFNKANELQGLVLGTGDLTEIAMGWCTYAGDHLSHYHVNASVPKTLVRYLIRWVADEEMAKTPAQKILYDVIDTPISPELRRPHKGEIAQKSEDIIGPVELADFYLYPFVRFGIHPGKILFLAYEASRQGLFENNYTLDELNKWLKSFIERFFKNQFKRTCMPEGPKLGSVSLSPRGDWRMPSDAVPKIWLNDIEQMYQRLKS